MNNEEVIRKAMSLLGSRTSPAKRRASRRNAAKGRNKMDRLANAGKEVRGRKPQKAIAA